MSNASGAGSCASHSDQAMRGWMSGRRERMMARYARMPDHFVSVTGDFDRMPRPPDRLVAEPGAFEPRILPYYYRSAARTCNFPVVGTIRGTPPPLRGTAVPSI